LESWNRFIHKTAEALESTLLKAVTDSSKYFHIIVKAYPLAPISDNKEPSFGICRVKPCETLTGRILHKCTKPAIRI